MSSSARSAPLVEVAQDAVVVTAVKLADDGSGDVVVRFHESRGGRTGATLTAGFEIGDVTVADLLERPSWTPSRGATVTGSPCWLHLRAGHSAADTRLSGRVCRAPSRAADPATA